MTQHTAASTSHPEAPHLTDRYSGFTDIVEAAQPAWDAPTPCEGWSVRDVVAHVIGTQRDFFTRHGLHAGPEPDLTAPAAAWRTHLDRVTTVLAQPGVLEREYDGFFGRTTIGATMSDFYGWDLVVHGWDIARATGQDWSLSEEAAAAMQTTADGWGQSLYADGICAPPVEVPHDAPAADRLLGRLGRDPSWTPS